MQPYASETIGDAVLELVITEYLYNKHPKENEGRMTAYRSALVNTNSISDAASELHMGDFLMLSKGEAKDTGRARLAILANTFEAVGNRVKEIYLNSKEEVNILDTLDKRERWIANYILNNGKIKAKDIASHFKISLNTANNWIKEWLENGFLVRENDKQIRNVDYILTKKYQEKIK
jgi:dsRNA-specific ribonuclease